jgi:hypothetical protein
MTGILTPLDFSAKRVMVRLLTSALDRLELGNGILEQFEALPAFIGRKTTDQRLKDEGAPVFHLVRIRDQLVRRPDGKHAGLAQREQPCKYRCRRAVEHGMSELQRHSRQELYLVHVNGVVDSVEETDYFDKILNFGALATQ